MSNFYLNGNAQMHGTRWIADGTTGVPVPMERVLAMCDSHAALLAAMREILASPANVERVIRLANAAIAKATQE